MTHVGMEVVVSRPADDRGTVPVSSAGRRSETTTTEISSAQSGGANIGDEAVDVGAQCCRLAAELLRREQHLVGRSSGLVG